MKLVARTASQAIAKPQPERRGDRSALACLIIVARHSGVHLTMPQLMHDNVLTGEQHLHRRCSQMREVRWPQGQGHSTDLG